MAATTVDSAPGGFALLSVAGRRVAVLFGGKVYACRHCHKRAYRTQQEQAHDQAGNRADTIRKRLGWEAGILNPPGGKAKGMHWRTFERLQAAHDAHTNQALAGMAAKLGLAMGRLEGIQTRWMSPKSNQY